MGRLSRLTVLAGCAAVLATGCGVQPPAQPAVPPPGASRASTGAGVRAGETATGRAAVTAAACTAARLAGRAGEFEDGMQFTQYLVLTNTGTSPCTLSGGPARVVGIEGDGGRRVLSPGVVRAALAGGYGDLTAPPATLAPGHSAQFALWTTAQCPPSAAVAYTALAVGIGATGSVRVPLPRGLPAALCGPLAVSGFGTAGPKG